MAYARVPSLLIAAVLTGILTVLVIMSRMATSAAADIGDPTRGAALFRQCAACHSVEPGVHLTECAVWDEDGARLTSPPVDPGREILDVEALVAAVPAAPVRVMVTFDARYDPAIFPYRPHHYAYLPRGRLNAGVGRQ